MVFIRMDPEGVDAVIVWGRGGDVVRVAKVAEMHCDGCDKARPFALVMTYRYWGIYWIFNMVTAREYFLACEACAGGYGIKKSKVETEMLKKPLPVPFMRQYGLATLIAAAGLIVMLRH